MSYNIKITYFGILRSISSWSKVARNIISELIKFGVDLNIYERKGFLYDEKFEVGNMERFVENRFKGDFVFTFEHPKNYEYLPQRSIKIGFLVYEFSRLPDLWVENINRYLDFVFVPSRFTYNVFKKSGVDIKRLKILRYGVDRNIYFRAKDNENRKDKIRFLTIASPHKREGVDLMLEAFWKAFSEVEDVELLLKLTYTTDKPKSFEIKNFNKLIEDYKNKLGEKLIINHNKLTEFEVANLYRSSDYYFSLSKAESFGLCFLESLACGKPTITLNYSGHSDFLNEENSYFIDYQLRKTNADEYEKTNYTQYIAFADIDDCICKLKKIYFEKTKKIFSFDYDYYDWKNIVDEFLKTIIK